MAMPAVRRALSVATAPIARSSWPRSMAMTRRPSAPVAHPASTGRSSHWAPMPVPSRPPSTRRSTVAERWPGAVRTRKPSPMSSVLLCVLVGVRRIVAAAVTGAAAAPAARGAKRAASAAARSSMRESHKANVSPAPAPSTAPAAGTAAAGTAWLASGRGASAFAVRYSELSGAGSVVWTPPCRPAVVAFASVPSPFSSRIAFMEASTSMPKLVAALSGTIAAFMSSGSAFNCTSTASRCCGVPLVSWRRSAVISSAVKGATGMPR